MGVLRCRVPVSGKFTKEVRNMKSKAVVLILMFPLIATPLVPAQEIVNLFDFPCCGS